jgi:formate dehydrogenase assembly factor FdhD
MEKHQNKTQNKTVTAVVSSEIHEALTDAAYQLRETQTKIASAAIVHYIDHLRKTKIIHHKPSTHAVGGFAVSR